MRAPGVGPLREPRGGASARALATALSRRGCPRLRRLDLSQNVIGAKGAAAAADVLLSQVRAWAAPGSRSSSASVSSSFKAHALEELDLRHNGCGDAGAAAVANALRESAAESAKRAKESRGIAPASLLDDARYEPRALRALRLGFNGVTEIGARALADALIAVRESARDALGEEAARDACVVRELDLACNAVGAAGARALGAALDSGVERSTSGITRSATRGADASPRRSRRTRRRGKCFWRGTTSARKGRGGSPTPCASTRTCVG